MKSRKYFCALALSLPILIVVFCCMSLSVYVGYEKKPSKKNVQPRQSATFLIDLLVCLPVGIIFNQAFQLAKMFLHFAISLIRALLNLQHLTMKLIIFLRLSIIKRLPREQLLVSSSMMLDKCN